MTHAAAPADAPRRRPASRTRPAPSASRTSCGWPGPSPRSRRSSPSACRRRPARAGSSGCEGFAIDVEADAPIVAQELRLRAGELLTAFAAAPGGVGVRELRVHVRRGGPRV